MIRVLKSQLSLEACQVGYRRSGAKATPSQPHAQEHHIALCLVAYLIVERERLEQGSLGANSSGVSSSRAHRSHYQHWSG